MHHPSNSGGPLTVAIIAGVILGVAAGIGIPGGETAYGIIGEVFLNLLFVLVIPLVVSSMITGITGLGDVRHLGALGLKTLAFYVSTTLLAVVTGIVLVNLIAPGMSMERSPSAFPDTDYRIVSDMSGGFDRLVLDDGIVITQRLDPVRHMVMLPDQNITGIPASGKTDGALVIDRWLGPQGREVIPESTGTGVIIETMPPSRPADMLGQYIPRNIVRSMAEEQIFPLILFSLFFGAVLSTTGAAGKPLIDLFNAINVTSIKCVMAVMWLAPLGVFGLIAGRIAEAERTMAGGFAAELARLAGYAGTVTLGLAIHGGVVLVLILLVLGKRHPFRYFKNLIPQLLTAFSTASSMATLPVALSLVTRKNKVSPRVAQFVLPLGATINMDGTALYEGVAAVFIAQLYQIPLSPLDQLIIILTATIAAVGAAAIPQAGLVTMVLVLRSVGLPLEGIGAIISIDWLLDRFRTTVNSWGDVVGAAVIDRLEGANEPES